MIDFDTFCIEIQSTLAKIVEQGISIERRLCNLEKAIYGNGNDGLIAKMAKLSQGYKTLFWLYGVILTGFIGLLFAYIRGGI